jgi:ABC-type nitrate/sulfonate/bicarbonate transport system permease component
MSNVKWGRAVLWIVLGLVIAFAITNLFITLAMVVRGFQLRGAPPREEQVAFILGAPSNIVAVLGTAFAAWLGGRATARRAEGGYTTNGLVVGVGVGVLMAAYSVFQRGLSAWMPVHAVLGIAGGYLGGLLGGKKAEAEDMYD